MQQTINDSKICGGMRQQMLRIFTEVPDYGQPRKRLILKYPNVEISF